MSRHESTLTRGLADLLKTAEDLAIAARREERTLPLYQVLEEEADALERRKDRVDPPPREPRWSAATPNDEAYWRLRVAGLTADQPPSSAVVDVEAANVIPLAHCLWEAITLVDRDPGSVPPLRLFLAKWVKTRLEVTARPATADAARPFFAAVNAYIDDGPLPARSIVVETEGTDPLLRDLLDQHPDHVDPLDHRYARRLVVEGALGSRVRAIHDRRLVDVVRRMHKRRHAALCLSGGGIRSATFALGLIQALARHGLLSRFQYLSTVSGGGYIGSWLSAWIEHDGRDAVEGALSHPPADLTDPEPIPVTHLRSYSNYLSPRVGMFSVDTWTLIATYTRNLLLTWLVLVPLLASIVMVPRIAASGVRFSAPQGLQAAILVTLLGAGLWFGASAVAFVHGNRPERTRSGHMRPASKPLRRRDQAAFLKHGLVPLCICAILLSTVWAWFTLAGGSIAASIAQLGAMTGVRAIQGVGAAIGRASEGTIGLVIFASLGAGMHLLGWKRADRDAGTGREGFIIVLTGGTAGALTYGVATLLDPTGRGARPEWYTALATPVLLVLLMLMSQLYTGAVSRRTHHSDDSEREWAARYNAWILVVAIIWAVAATLVLLVPLALSELDWHGVAGLTGFSGITGWITAKLGNSGETGAKTQSAESGEDTGSVAAAVAKRIGLALAAPLFAVSLVVLLSWMDAGLLYLAGKPFGLFVGTTSVANAAREAPWWLTIAVGTLLLVASLQIAKYIDTNKFSLHAMYRMRLIRAYLGASRRASERSPDPFTGFDEKDNLPMAELRPAASPDRPLHIVNVALNLVSGARLSWQERKAESFTISPLHAGSAELGYRRTSYAPAQAKLAAARDEALSLIEEAGDQLPNARKHRRSLYALGPFLYGGEQGVSLGTAITISGAAASPNMGYHSSPAITFLMTLFNARLGWWLGNPGPEGRHTFHLASPTAPISPILDELFGRTDDRRPYVYLSDGGHFENLGIYEMVRRRCRFILVSDAGCDPTCGFEDIGNAIRKVRVDLGIPIEFDPDHFDIKARSEDGTPEASGSYWALGRIGYSNVDAPPGMDKDDAAREYDGLLVYVKPCFYGGEPRDVYNYAIRNAAFPHEATSDQWFGEAQFESYRSLGEFVGSRLCEQENIVDFFGGTYPPPQRGTPMPVEVGVGE